MQKHSNLSSLCSTKINLKSNLSNLIKGAKTIKVPFSDQLQAIEGKQGASIG